MALALGALGVVFGDIGTSPLYTLNETLGVLPGAARAEAILGSLSLIAWALSFAVCFKYLGFVTLADNRGEGGVFALLALSQTRDDERSRGRAWLTFVVLVGAALLYGDGVITPAISVLGATEGLVTLRPSLEPFVPAIAAGILLALFSIQHRGSGAIGRAFGPVMLLWFATLALFGIVQIVRMPEVLRALNPILGVRLLLDHPAHATSILGTVTLAITGTEALYADMGHFGRRAIALAWYTVAFPGLALSYFGQGAFALAHPENALNPFFAQAPAGWWRGYLIALSTAAAIIASQALISGTFSLTRQAIQLGYFPRLNVRHTNADEIGQIYLPLVNVSLAVLSVSVVLIFGSVARLATAYGIAVTATMLITTLAFYRVARARWHWSRARALALCLAFLTFDAAFLLANIHKFPDGGWLPFALGVLVLALMYAWKSGRQEVQRRVYQNSVTQEELLEIARSPHLLRVEGAAVFMMGTAGGAPLALLHHLRANQCMHQTVILLTLATELVPAVGESERFHLEDLGEGIWRVIGRFGYMESPDATKLLASAAAAGVPIDPAAATYFFNREIIQDAEHSRLRGWEKGLYSFLSRNARPAKDYFNIPPSQIIELGLTVYL
ncbi:MAG: KUP/HAK/KT family potassium transporter [Opitutaceae bacterium]|nr:KUP/HAK/KT family potassium transporter [Opitutaceae bacterium]